MAARTAEASASSTPTPKTPSSKCLERDRAESMGHDYGWHSSPSLPRVLIPPPLITPPPFFRTGPHVPMSPPAHIPALPLAGNAFLQVHSLKI